MIQISVKTSQKGKFDTELLDNIKIKLPGELRQLATESRDYMRRTIQDSKVRPDSGEHTLENAIDVEEFIVANGYGFGVGNISVLERVAPYFAILNFGGEVSPHRVPTGAFVPGEPKPMAEHFREGNWNVGAGNYSFVAGKKPLVGISYIEKTFIYLKNKQGISKGVFFT